MPEFYAKCKGHAHMRKPGQKAGHVLQGRDWLVTAFHAAFTVFKLLNLATDARNLLRAVVAVVTALGRFETLAFSP